MTRYIIDTCVTPNSSSAWDYERLCIIEINISNGDHDSREKIIMIATNNPFIKNTNSYNTERKNQLNLLMAACKGLNEMLD